MSDTEGGERGRGVVPRSVWSWRSSHLWGSTFSPAQIANGDAVDGSGSLEAAGCYVCPDWTPVVRISISKDGDAAHRSTVDNQHRET